MSSQKHHRTLGGSLGPVGGLAEPVVLWGAGGRPDSSLLRH